MAAAALRKKCKGLTTICTCGAFVPEQSRAEHKCGQNDTRRAAKASMSAGFSGFSALSVPVQDLKDLRDSKDSKQNSKGLPPLDKIDLLVAKRRGWTFEYDGLGQLCIVVHPINQRTKKEETFKCKVIEDSRLPVHCSRFECNGRHFYFEWFM